MFSFFHRKSEIDAFAKTMADEFSKTLPIDHIRSFEEKKYQNKLDKGLAKIIREVGICQSKKKMGVYYKARFHMIFMDRLREIGYPEDLIQNINKAVMLATP